MSTKDDVDEERDRNQSLSTNDIDVRLTKSMSQRERQLLHPLEVACWLQIMYFQCFYFGWDPTFRFEWVKCTNDANATWNGGFDWDC